MTVNLHPYPVYESSGVEWLGDMPVHCEVRRAKHFYVKVDKRSDSGAEELVSVSHRTEMTPRKKNVTIFMVESNIGH